MEENKLFPYGIQIIGKDKQIIKYKIKIFLISVSNFFFNLYMYIYIHIYRYSRNLLKKYLIELVLI